MFSFFKKNKNKEQDKTNSQVQSYTIATEPSQNQDQNQDQKQDNQQQDNQQPDKQNIMQSSLSGKLKRTRDIFIGGLANIFSGKKTIDQELLKELEEKLLMADVGISVTKQLLDKLKKKAALVKELNAEIILQILKDELVEILSNNSQSLVIDSTNKPFVILLVGVNGSGKTTTIGKLAAKFKQEDLKVMLAAGDTYRAAAIEQLQIWGQRNDITVIAQKQGSDSAAVLYDACSAAKSRNVDVLIADTAGRLHTQGNLIAELKKIKRIIQKFDPSAPHEILLVLDATFGQNALNQAQQFQDAVGVSGICLTKLDGTAKGGIIFAIAQTTKIPIRFIGVGEGIEDLRVFNAKEFVEALF